MTVLLVLILTIRMHVFVALLLSSILIGLLAGMRPDAIVGAITKGMGDTLSTIAIIVGLGTLFGKMLEVTGGANALADSLLNKTGEKSSRGAMLLAGYIVGIPVFFNAGLVILAPTVYGLSKKSGKPLMFFALPLLAGMVATHTFVPPTPGPIAAAGLMGVDLGWVILFGAIAALPAALLGGLLYGTFITKKVTGKIPDSFFTPSRSQLSRKKPPSTFTVILLIALPLLLILAGSVASLSEGNSDMAKLVQFVGHPFLALLICTLLSMVILGKRRGVSGKQLQEIATAALEPAGVIILVIGAGGVLKQILMDSEVGELLTRAIVALNVGPLLLSFLLAASMRLLQGSGTVAMVCAAGLVSAIVPVGQTDPKLLALMVIAMGSGAGLERALSASFRENCIYVVMPARAS